MRTYECTIGRVDRYFLRNKKKLPSTVLQKCVFVLNEKKNIDNTIDYNNNYDNNNNGMHSKYYYCCETITGNLHR